MKTLYSIVVLLMLTGAVVAAEPVAEAPPADPAERVEADIAMENAKADPAYGVKYTEDRVYNLPKDQGKLFLTVVGKPGEAKFEELKDWFKTNKRLKGIAVQVHFNAYANTDAIAKDRFPNAKSFPFIRLQNAKAQRLFEVFGQDVPMSPDALANAIERDVDARVQELTEGPLGIFGNRNGGRKNCPDCDNVNNRRQDRRDERRNDSVPDEDGDPQPLDENDNDEVAPLLSNSYFPVGLAVLFGLGGFLFGGWPEISSRSKKALAPTT